MHRRCSMETSRCSTGDDLRLDSSPHRDADDSTMWTHAWRRWARWCTLRPGRSAHPGLELGTLWLTGANGGSRENPERLGRERATTASTARLGVGPQHRCARQFGEPSSRRHRVDCYGARFGRKSQSYREPVSFNGLRTSSACCDRRSKSTPTGFGRRSLAAAACRHFLPRNPPMK
jgi:hypothetical protein